LPYCLPTTSSQVFNLATKGIIRRGKRLLIINKHFSYINIAFINKC
jgi:hypothetical protein